jgi:hypothetical protein
MSCSISVLRHSESDENNIKFPDALSFKQKTVVEEQIAVDDSLLEVVR